MQLRAPIMGALAFAYVLAALPAAAHHRDFAFLRDWYLPYKGEREIESRTSWFPGVREWGQEFEFEYGIDDHFAIEPGIEWHQDPGGPLHLDGMDVELRFNFGRFAYNTPLFALNVEYEHPVDEAEVDHGEIKFITSVYGEDGSDLSLNINVGTTLEGPKENEGEALLGYVRQIGTPRKCETHNYNLGTRAGIETMYDFNEHHFGAGPVFVYRSNEHVNLVATFMFGLNHGGENPNQFKLIGEYEF